MASGALQELLLGIAEVSALRSSPPRKGGRRLTAVQVRAATLAHRRACTVLLCSHYERYLYSLNEHATDYLNSSALPSEQIPLEVRLLQAKQSVDLLGAKQWNTREADLRAFVAEHAHMWIDGRPVTSLNPQPHLEWMKSPKVKDVIRFFRLFGIRNIFESVSRTPSGRSRLTLGIQSLVDSRNGIAHGDMTVQPERQELTQYLSAVRDFCVRADRVLGIKVEAIGNNGKPW